MKIQVTFSGGAELERALRGLDAQVAGRLGARAVLDGAWVLAHSAEMRVPQRTGELKASITVVEDRTSRGPTSRERTAWIGTRLFYGRFVEFGTVKMSPRAFLRPAVDEDANEAINALATSLAAGIDRESKKFGR